MIPGGGRGLRHPRTVTAPVPASLVVRRPGFGEVLPPGDGELPPPTAAEVSTYQALAAVAADRVRLARRDQRRAGAVGSVLVSVGLVGVQHGKSTRTAGALAAGAGAVFLGVAAAAWWGGRRARMHRDRLVRALRAGDHATPGISADELAEVQFLTT